MTEQRAVTCPQCGDEKQNIGNHWRLSHSCDYPEPTARQTALIHGLLFAGGNINPNQAGRNPQLVTTSTRRSFLDWIDTEMGVLSRDIFVRGTTQDLREDLQPYYTASDRADDPPTTSVSDEKDIYEWRSRNLPFLKRYRSNWYTDSEKTVPETVDGTPLFFRVVYAKRGTLYTMDKKQYAVITVTNVPASLDRCESLFADFNPHVREHNSLGVEQLVLYDTRGFFNHIGWDALPGYADEWPTPDDPLSPTNSETWVMCPDCQKEYAGIANHWASSDSCEYPPLSETQREILKGVLIGGGGLTAPGRDKHSAFTIYSTDTTFLEWLDDVLGMFSTGVRLMEPQSERTPDAFPDSWEITEEAEFADVYFLSSRAHPILSAYRDEWYTVDGEKRVPDTLDQSDALLYALYACRGTQLRRGGATSPQPGLPITQINADEEMLCELFAEFDPELHMVSDSRRLVVTDMTRFRQMLHTLAADVAPDRHQDLIDI